MCITFIFISKLCCISLTLVIKGKVHQLGAQSCYLIATLRISADRNHNGIRLVIFSVYPKFSRIPEMTNVQAWHLHPMFHSCISTINTLSSIIHYCNNFQCSYLQQFAKKGRRKLEFAQNLWAIGAMHTLQECSSLESTELQSFCFGNCL
jgi:hypothetical protein